MTNSHHKNVQYLAALITIIGGAFAIYMYFDNRRDKKTQSDVAELDRQIKELEHANQLHLAKKNGIIV